MDPRKACKTNKQREWLRQVFEPGYGYPIVLYMATADLIDLAVLASSIIAFGRLSVRFNPTYTLRVANGVRRMACVGLFVER